VDIDLITERIIGGAISVHREFGPGLLESTYEACLAHVLAMRGLTVERQVVVPIVFEGMRLECGYRIDMLVERTVVVELKTVARIEPVHIAQVLTYLKLSGRPLGLLINFNVVLLKDGIRRVIHQRQENASARSATSEHSAARFSADQR
jgi:GxxExxY protein